jgi:lysine 2,3-aminomutase
MKRNLRVHCLVRRHRASISRCLTRLCNKNKLKVVWNFNADSVGSTRSSEKTLEFRRQFFKDVTESEWNNWHWQLRHRITSLSELERFLSLSEEEREAGFHRDAIFPVAITPYFLSLLEKDNPEQSLRRVSYPLKTSTCTPRKNPKIHWEKKTIHRYRDWFIGIRTGFFF